MKTYLNKPIFHVNTNTYLMLIIFLAPLLNFNYSNLTQLALIFSVLISLQVLLFIFVYRKIFDTKKVEAT